VTDVAMHLLVSAQGTVENAEVVKPVREDLDEEAKKVVSTWVFDPGTCDGHAQQCQIDVTVHFQAGDGARLFGDWMSIQPQDDPDAACCEDHN
jgi:TonB family protein